VSPLRDGSSRGKAQPGGSTVSIRVEGTDQVGEVRRTVAAMASKQQFDEPQSARAALIATESATNLLRHAGGGEILLTPLEDSAIELLVLDKGPGMANTELCFQDGYSTAGSSGTGMGAIQRLSSHCEIYTVPGKGTALLARLGGPADAGAARYGGFELGGVCVPKRGETASGDSWAIYRGPDFANVLVVDGLGHGPVAAESAVAAVGAFLEDGGGEPAEVLAELHPALRHTRGAAAAVARFEFERREMKFAGLGNIAAAILNGDSMRQAVCQPGILGHDRRNLREFVYPWPHGSLAVLYSDGIATHWSAATYNGLWSRHVSLISGVLYRDMVRERDDATVLAVRYGANR
jgi:anti-sigma regulatory factor (Ser/Thr protein kinase)